MRETHELARDARALQKTAGIAPEVRHLKIEARVGDPYRFGCRRRQRRQKQVLEPALIL